MKKIIISFLMLAVSAATFSQQTKTIIPQLTKTDYLQKSMNQKKAAWILLGGGATLVLTGILIPQGDYTGIPYPFNVFPYLDSHKNDGIKGALGLSGTLTMLGSIPLFIASAKNKRKAMSLSFKNEKAPVIQQSGINTGYYPALSIKIGL